jgi:GTP-binding protein
VEAAGYTAFAISAAAHQGTEELMNYAADRLREIQQEETERAAAQPMGAIDENAVLRPLGDDAFTIAKEDGVFVVRGRLVQRAVNMTDQESEEGMARMQVVLERMGVTKALEEAGVKVGDVVRFGKAELYWGE